MSASLKDASPAQAAKLLEALFPSEHERYAVLARLLKSADIANVVAPRAWAVTLYPNMFRLNVGQAEVYVAWPGRFFLNCSASIGTPPFDTSSSEETKYRTVTGAQCHFLGALRDLEHLPSEVELAHAKFIDLAARAPSGKPRAGTPLRKSHCEALLACARKGPSRSPR